MVYSRMCRPNKRTAIVGKVLAVFPEVEIDCLGKKQKILFTKPCPAEKQAWIRVFGASRNGIFIADAFHMLKNSEARHFSRFRKRVRQFYKSELNLNLHPIKN
ncbi:uncharacterized protein NEMAJ01_0054 [Nematocida major]|uniref:uncharacterized protein n=1 Tax=Nematocida major TaxID=1912982 RepID=UPI002008EAC6|nr:uncharacterized protein NEMAJ01_0054 [Nematocida major]KAH9385158.1 hypothetical protein NEMAJ01_0054 [Nematocida major]